MTPENFALYERTANVLSHILAVNVGYSLFVDHPRLKLLIIDNPTHVPFITADQPGHQYGSDAQGVYSPQAVRRLLSRVADESVACAGSRTVTSLPDRLTLTPMEAHFYNLRIASRAFQQVFAGCREDLEAIRSDLPAYV